jgi:hypothetical protein
MFICRFATDLTDIINKKKDSIFANKISKKDLVIFILKLNEMFVQ